MVGENFNIQTSKMAEIATNSKYIKQFFLARKMKNQENQGKFSKIRAFKKNQGKFSKIRKIMACRTPEVGLRDRKNEKRKRN